MKNNMMTALKNLEKAMYDVLIAWDMFDINGFDSTLDNYPYQESFEIVCDKVSTWVGAIIEDIKNDRGISTFRLLKQIKEKDNLAYVDVRNTTGTYNNYSGIAEILYDDVVKIYTESENQCDLIISKYQFNKHFIITNIQWNLKEGHKC